MAKYLLQVVIETPDDYDPCWQGPQGAVQCFTDTVVEPAVRGASESVSLYGKGPHAEYFARKLQIVNSVQVLPTAELHKNKQNRRIFHRIRRFCCF